MEENGFMKQFNRWDLPEADSRLELVFQDRFKDYGAYQVRKLFRRSQALATVVTVVFVVFIALIPRIVDSLSKEPEVKKKPKFAVSLEDIKAPDEEKEEKPKEPPKLKEPEPVATQAYVAPKINPDAENEDVINPPDVVTNTGLKNIEGQTDPTAPDLGGEEGPTGGGDEGPVADVQVKASFPGGELAFREYVGSTFQYPVRCQDEGINGSVVLRFIVDQSGRVSKVSAIEETKSCPEFTEEAIRVLKKSPRWIPGQNKGRFVISWREIPIKLTIE